MIDPSVKIHSTATVSPEANIGASTTIWHYSHVRENTQIGSRCIISQGVYVDFDVQIGDLCKIQNNAMIYHPARIGRGVFIGPGVILTNDKYPRALDAAGEPNSSWEPLQTVIEEGASIGAGAIILPGVKIGRYAMVGSGAVVSRDVSDFDLVIGCPARSVAKVDKEGKIVERYEKKA